MAKFIGRLYAMSASEILNHVPDSIYSEIKAKDAHPLFRAYIIGHEGAARPSIVGIGSVVINWYKELVRKIAEKLRFGTEIFFRHEIANENYGRTPIGQVVGKTLATVRDRISAIAIVYIRPEWRHLPLDIASIEANIRFDEKNLLSGNEEVSVVDIEEITGIALGNSKADRPAFPGATIISELQAFANKKGRVSDDYGGGDDGKEPLKMEFTIEDVRSFLKTEKVRPSDLFGTEILLTDPVVKGFVAEERRIATSGEYAHRKRTEEAALENEQKLKNENESLKKRVSELEIGVASSKIPTLLASKAKDRKFDEKLLKFVEARLATFVPKEASSIEKDFDSFLDANVEEFRKVASIFGVKDDAKKNADDGEANLGGEPQDRGSESDNPFIPSMKD